MKSKKGRPQKRKFSFARLGRWMRSIGYFITLGYFGIAISVLGPALPDLAELVSVDLGSLSALFSARSIGILFGSLLAGWAFDKYAGHTFFAVSFLALGITFGFQPLNRSYWILVGMTTLQGLAFGILGTGASTFIVWEHDDNPEPWVNTQSFINSLGGFMAPLLLTFSYARFAQFDQAFWTLALAASLLATYFFFLNSPKIRTQAREHEEREKDPALIVVLVAMLFLIYVGVEVSLNGWIFSLATLEYGFAADNARLLNSILWGAMAIGRLSNVAISRLIKPAKQLLISFTGSAVAMLGIILFRDSAVVLWAGMVVIGWFFATIFPSLMVYAEQTLNMTGKKSGLFYAATSVGSMILPYIAGLLLGASVPHGVVWVALGATMIEIGILMYLRAKLPANA